MSSGRRAPAGHAAGPGAALGRRDARPSPLRGRRSPGRTAARRPAAGAFAIGGVVPQRGGDDRGVDDARKELLAKEKDLTRQWDALNAACRNLPMVEVQKDYTFDGPAPHRQVREVRHARLRFMIAHFADAGRRRRLASFRPGADPPAWPSSFGVGPGSANGDREGRLGGDRPRRSPDRLAEGARVVATSRWARRVPRGSECRARPLPLRARRGRPRSDQVGRPSTSGRPCSAESAARRTGPPSASPGVSRSS